MDLTFSLDESDSQINALLVDISIVSLILACITIGLIFYIVRKATAPIENLKEGFGFTNVTVNITKSSDVPYVTYEAAADSVATDKLYEIAAQIVKLLAG
jgi:hypothetical protein